MVCAHRIGRLTRAIGLTVRKPRILYFDIDGVLLDYQDNIKAALDGGALERALKAARIDRLICVSGWADMSRETVLDIPLAERPGWVYRKFSSLIPDRRWCLERLELGSDTDHRGRLIDLTTDWYYVDDWADKFFIEANGPAAFAQWRGRRILMADPFGDGTDVLRWLARIASTGSQED